MKQPDPDKVRALSDRAARLGKLKDQPGWAELKAIAEREQNKYWNTQFKRLRDGEPIDENDLRAHRLAFDLVDYLLAHPERAETELRRALEKAERFGAIQEEVLQ